MTASCDPLPIQSDSGKTPQGWSRWGLWLSFATLAGMALSTPFIGYAAISVLVVDPTTPMEWVPKTFAPRRVYEAFAEQFQSGDVVVLSWSGCELGSPALDRLVDATTGPQAPRNAAGQLWFDAVVSGSRVIDTLTAEPLLLDRTTAVNRLKGILVGPDGRTTCMVIAFTREGVTDRKRAMAWIGKLVMQTAVINPAEIVMAGPIVDNAAVDLASTNSLKTFAPPAAAVILLLTWWSLRSFFYACLIFVVSLWCVGLSFATLAACGDRMNPVLIVMPLLVLVLGVSGGIHLVNYLLESLAHGGPRGVATRAIQLGWLPCVLSAGTTAIGLGSLIVSELEPIRVFGFHAAIGVMATCFCMFLVVPGFFERWPMAASAAPHEPVQKASGQRVALGVMRFATPIVVILFLAMGAMGAGVSGIRTSVQIDTLFQPGSRVIRDYVSIEKKIGPLVPIEVILRFADGHDVRPVQRLELIEAIQHRLSQMEGVSAVLSAATFMPESTTAGGVGSIARKAIAARKLMQNLVDDEQMKYIRNIEGSQLWRVTARTSALQGIDYGKFLQTAQDAIDPLVAAAGGQSRGITTAYTGAMTLVHAIQNALLHDLFTSFLSACVMMSLVMMVVEGGIAAGLVAMISNVFPMILLFGFLGWTRTPLDIGSVMTASIALGMAIDGTLHFLTFFRRAIETGATPKDAVLAAFEHCAAAMTQSAVVCGLGILVCAASSFVPTSRFAWMLCLLLAAALMGDLVLLPAMLVGPLGSIYKRRP